jgi:hypothetical protein
MMTAKAFYANILVGENGYRRLRDKQLLSLSAGAAWSIKNLSV